MLIVPLDPTRTLLAVGAAVPQVDRETGAQALDRNTRVPLFDVPLVMPLDEGQALTMRVSVPENGLADTIGLGSLVKVAGLTLVTDVKNGKAWYVYRGNVLTVAKG
jgi:hypothetical protein